MNLPNPPRDSVPSPLPNQGVTAKPQTWRDPASNWQQEPGAGQSFNLRRFFRSMLERRWWFLSTLFIGIALTMIITFRSIPIYQAMASVQVLREEPVSTEFKQVMDGSIKNSEDFNTQVRLLESYMLARRVSSRLKPDQVKQLTEPYRSKSPFAIDKEPMDILVKHRSIVPIRLSLMVQIHYKHPNPEIAAMVANLFSEEFLSYNVLVRSEGTVQAIDGLRQRAEEQRRKTEQSEMALADFRETHKNLSFDEATNIDQQQILLLSSEVTRRQIERDDAHGLWDQVVAIQNKNGDLSELNIIRDNPVVMRLRQQLSEAKVELSRLSERYRSKHPRFVEARGMVDKISEELTAVVSQSARSVENAYRRADDLYTQTQANLMKKQDEIVQRQKFQVEYNSMERQHKINLQMFQYFQTRMEQAVSQASESAPNVRVVDSAFVPAKPIKPNIPMNLAVGSLVSLIAGLALTLAVVHFDDRIKTVNDVEDRLQLPVLGVVTQLVTKDNPSMGRIVAERLQHSTVEEFRTIRSSLDLLSSGEPRPLILITSATAMEGKSFLACNLAASFGAHQERTLLVDCDLRRPNIAKSLGLTPGIGLIQLLRDKVSLDEVIQRNVFPNVDVLPSGGSTDHATELLGRIQIASLTAELRKRYDRVVFDTPPAGLVSDALGLLCQVDGVILLIKHRTLPFYKAERVTKLLKGAHARLLGVVINYVNTNASGFYYDDYYKQRDYYSKNEMHTPGPGEKGAAPATTPASTGKKA